MLVGVECLCGLRVVLTASSLFCRKRAGQPLQLVGFQRNHIETACRLLDQTRQIVTRGQHNTAAFARIDTARRPAIRRRVAAGAHLDKDQRAVGRAHDQVDLAAPHPIITLDQPQAAGLQLGTGLRFCRLPQTARRALLPHLQHARHVHSPPNRTGILRPAGFSVRALHGGRAHRQPGRHQPARPGRAAPCRPHRGRRHPGGAASARSLRAAQTHAALRPAPRGAGRSAHRRRSGRGRARGFCQRRGHAGHQRSGQPHRRRRSCRRAAGNAPAGRQRGDDGAQRQRSRSALGLLLRGLRARKGRGTARLSASRATGFAGDGVFRSPAPAARLPAHLAGSGRASAARPRQGVEQTVRNPAALHAASRARLARCRSPAGAGRIRAAAAAARGGSGTRHPSHRPAAAAGTGVARLTRGRGGGRPHRAEARCALPLVARSKAGLIERPALHRRRGFTRPDFHPVASGLFGAVERLVGAVEQFVGVHQGGRGKELGNADAGGQRQAIRRARGQAAGFLNGQPQALRHIERDLPRGLRQQNGELIAPQPSTQIGPAQLLHAGLRKTANDSVAHLMAEAVVDLFETVDVQRQHHERAALTLRAAQLQCGAGQKVAAVRNAGERVGVGQIAQFAFARLGLGDVLEGEDQRVVVAVTPSGDRQQQPDLGAVEPTELGLHAAHDAAFALQPSQQLIAIDRVAPKRPHRLPGVLRIRAAEQTVGDLVGKQQRRVAGAGDDQRHRRLFREEAKALLVFAELLLQLLDGGDVLHAGDHAHDLATDRVTHQRLVQNPHRGLMIGMQIRRFARDLQAAGEQLAVHVFPNAAQRRAENLRSGTAVNFRAAEPDEQVEGDVHPGEPPLRIAERHRVGQGVEQRFLKPQLRLCGGLADLQRGGATVDLFFQRGIDVAHLLDRSGALVGQQSGEQHGAGERQQNDLHGHEAVAAQHAVHRAMLQHGRRHDQQADDRAQGGGNRQRQAHRRPQQRQHDQARQPDGQRALADWHEIDQQSADHRERRQPHHFPVERRPQGLQRRPAQQFGGGGEHHDAGHIGHPPLHAQIGRNGGLAKTEGGRGSGPHGRRDPRADYAHGADEPETVGRRLETLPARASPQQPQTEQRPEDVARRDQGTGLQSPAQQHVVAHPGRERDGRHHRRPARNQAEGRNGGRRPQNELARPHPEHQPGHQDVTRSEAH